MKPSEQATQLFEKYLAVHTTLHCKKGCITIDSIGNDSAIRCAEIAVDEIIDILPFDDLRYWQEVKNELEKLWVK